MPANARDEGSIPVLRRSPREGNYNPLQYSCLGNPTEEPGGLQPDTTVAKQENIKTFSYNF